MLKKFTEGLVFGGGFGISFLALWYVAAYLITPMFFGSQIEQVTNAQLSELDANAPASISQSPNSRPEAGPPFHELKIEEQIKKSSVIALAKFELSSDGKMKAIIKEFLKKEPDVKLYYNEGDEYASSSYYPTDKTSYGDGLVIFFVGSPATMRMAMSYEGDRIRGLGDIPLELFKKKCEEPNA